MIIKKISAVLTAALMSISLAYTVNADATAVGDDVKYTVEFRDYDGNLIMTHILAQNEAIDYSLIDTSSDTFNKNITKNTEIRFSSWSYNGDYAPGNITIYALFQRATISLDSTPERSEFYSKTGNINLDGLNVSILLETQTAKKDSDDQFIIESQEFNISSACYTVPASLDSAFKDSDSSSVEMYPPNSNIPIYTYDITYYNELGDYNSDSTADATDASSILSYYANVSTGLKPEITARQKKNADVNLDGVIDATDASLVLNFYALNATGAKPQWEELLLKLK